MHRKIIQQDLSNFIDKKSIKDLPLKTIKVTIYTLKWVFLMIFMFITICIFGLFFTGGESYLQIILGYSITGFFTFFLSYFGWLLAHNMIVKINSKANTGYAISYYFRKNNK